MLALPSPGIGRLRAVRLMRCPTAGRAVPVGALSHAFGTNIVSRLFAAGGKPELPAGREIISGEPEPFRVSTSRGTRGGRILTGIFVCLRDQRVVPSLERGDFRCAELPVEHL